MSTDARIGAQVAAKAAATLFAGSSDTDGAMKAMARFYAGIDQLAGPAEADSPPVSTQPLAQPALAAAGAALAAGGVQAEVVRDLSGEEARWHDALNAYPKDWYNNVGDAKASSGGGKGPDFRFKDEKADIKPLWLTGQYGPAPAWVFEKLNLQFPGAPAVAAPAPAPQGPPLVTTDPPATIPDTGGVPPDEAPF